MNLLTVTRRMRTYPSIMTARRSKWPETKAIIYNAKIKSFVVKEGGGLYLFTTDYVFANDWEFV